MLIKVKARGILPFQKSGVEEKNLNFKKVSHWQYCFNTYSYVILPDESKETISRSIRALILITIYMRTLDNFNQL